MLRGPLLLALLLVTATASAAESSYSLTYRPAEGCPTREEFVAELGARSQDVHEASNESARVSLDVWFEGQAPIQGVLLLRDDAGQTSRRAIPGATCEEVVAALALTASLLIDAQIQASATVASVVPEPSAPTAPVLSAAVRPPPAAVADEGPEPPDGAESRSTFRVRVGAGVAVEHGIAPNVAAAGAFDLAVRWRSRSIVEPVFGVTLERTLPETVTLDRGKARFRWTALRVGFCPLRFPSEGSLLFRPCASLEGGAIAADGDDVPEAKEVTTPWWAAGVSGRAELGLIEPLSGLFELGARLQFKQDRFYFDPDSPDSTVFEVPRAGLWGRVGVQAEF
jgi:hypothetical protein